MKSDVRNFYAACSAPLLKVSRNASSMLRLAVLYWCLTVDFPGTVARFSPKKPPRRKAVSIAETETELNALKESFISAHV